MATSTDELINVKPDKEPTFSPLGKDDEKPSLFERMKREREGRRKAPTAPTEPSQSREGTSATTRAKVSGKGRSNHEKRANKVSGVLSNMSLALSLLSVMRPHTHTEVINGQRVKVADPLYLLDAKCVMDAAPLVGEQWASWADENERIAKMIDSLSAGSAAAGAIASLGAIAIPILANHGKVPAEIAQRFAPDALEAMIKEAKEARDEE